VRALTLIILVSILALALAAQERTPSTIHIRTRRRFTPATRNLIFLLTSPEIKLLFRSESSTFYSPALMIGSPNISPADIPNCRANYPLSRLDILGPLELGR